MNKKFFAALASATMAFSATGSLAVFAQDFEDETQQNVPGTGDNYSEVNLYDVMDYKLIDAVKKAYDDANTAAGKTLDPAHALKSQLNTITALELKDSTGNATSYAGALKDVEDFRGIEYLTKLTTFSLSAATGQPASNATTVDLSENSELETATIVSDKLADLELPVEGKLTTLTVSGDTKRAPIHKIDFRGSVATINVTKTGLVKADLSGVTALKTASFTDSPIFSVNVNGLSKLTNLTVAKTNLKKLDVTTNKNLTDLILNDNHLDELDLSNNKKLENLNIDNNYFASIDLTHNRALADNWTAQADGTAATGEQTLYTSAAYDTVDLTGLKGFVLKNSGIFAGADGTEYDGLDPVKDEDGEPTGVCKLVAGADHFYQYDGTGAFDADKPLLTVNIDNNAELMNRLYNPNSGEHFYTKDLNEKDVLTGLGWVDEGIGWVAPLKDGNEPVYRLYNPNAGDHHYTRDLNEKTFLVAHGWKDEGIGWYSLPDTANDKKLPLFRQYNPNATGAGSHNYTTDVEENDFLVNIGWVAEGEAWNALK